MTVHVPTNFDADAFWAKVDRTGECWLWAGATLRGYGRVTVRTDGSATTMQAHRIAYELLVESIPDDMQLDHTCRVRSCVRPNHMDVVTNRENTLRSDGVTAINSRKTHCVHGHEFTPENTIRRKNGNRRCRECQNRLARDWWHRNRATAAEATAAVGKTSTGVSTRAARVG